MGRVDGRVDGSVYEHGSFVCKSPRRRGLGSLAFGGHELLISSKDSVRSVNNGSFSLDHVKGR